jgi:hypothetical protein
MSIRSSSSHHPACIAMPLAANAQLFCGLPGMPEMVPGMGSGSGMKCPAFGGPPLPPICQQVLAMRNETTTNAAAIRAVSEKAKPPDPAATCELFKVYVASERKFIEGLRTNAQTCGFPRRSSSRPKRATAKPPRSASRSARRRSTPRPRPCTTPMTGCSSGDIQAGKSAFRRVPRQIRRRALSGRPLS